MLVASLVEAISELLGNARAIEVGIDTGAGAALAYRSSAGPVCVGEDD